jgi:precorrin-3B methylase
VSSLTLVGTGYRVAGQVTPETRSVMEQADVLLYLVTDPATSAWLRSLNPRASSLHDSYREGEDGVVAARRMAERMVAPLRDGRSVCAAFSGHPGVLVHAARLAAEQARAESFAVSMLPAISCEDCLFADLGVDPAVPGRVLFDATDFLLRPRDFDTTAALVLLQAGAVGLRDYRVGREPNRDGLRVLSEALRRWYPAEHPVVLYEAGTLPPFEPTIVRLPLADLGEAPASVVSTLYVSPLPPAPIDEERAARLRASVPTAAAD